MLSSGYLTHDGLNVTMLAGDDWSQKAIVRDEEDACLSAGIPVESERRSSLRLRARGLLERLTHKFRIISCFCWCWGAKWFYVVVDIEGWYVWC